MPRDSERKPIRRLDYRPPDYLVDAVELTLELAAQRTVVDARLHVRPNPLGRPGAWLRLDGEGQELLGVSIDSRPLAPSEYRLDSHGLTLPPLNGAALVEIASSNCPQANTALEGLYLSGGVLLTQCEAEGFRRITYFPDRPDVLARFRVRLIASRERFPVLLSNGNLVEARALAGERHLAVWEDPFPKPGYLFALVAGALACIEDTFVTASGRRVLLQVWSKRENLDRCGFALEALGKAMRWDERTHGLEYDLDRYMIFCADDFNMGAMENKGLNIFNSKYLLARPDTATDDDYLGIQNVVAHEYFHNWTGNRVTCRDWFQLSLKEGWTVFREQAFAADHHSHAVERIAQADFLRTRQFPEDAGPLAHPVRPESYVEINNCYTATVYEKGAEVVRMLHTLIGPEAYRRGTALYFERHDGQAVTCDDFVTAMEDASGRALAGLRRWYAQSGTPVLHVSGVHDAAAGCYTLRVQQTCGRPEGGQPPPLHIPFEVGLLAPDGSQVPLVLEGEPGPGPASRVLEITRTEEVFRFVGVPSQPRLSLLRGFSAPVRVEHEHSDEDLAFLLARDSDAFARWDAGQRLMLRELVALAGATGGRGEAALSDALTGAVRRVLREGLGDPAWTALAIALPEFGTIAQASHPIQVEAIATALRLARADLARRLRAELLSACERCATPGPYVFEPSAVARRRLRQRCLEYLVHLEDGSGLELAATQFERSDNMTDAVAALSALNDRECLQRERAMQAFRERWSQDPLVMDKWLALQARADRPDTFATVRSLFAEPWFDRRNPNRVRALVSSFAEYNWARFHQPGGEPYEWLATCVLECDRRNPQLAARLAHAFERWRQFPPERAALMQGALGRIAAASDLSPELDELVRKMLDAGRAGPAP